MKAIKQRIFVGGLDINTGQKDLEQHFSQFGELDSVEVIIERKTGKNFYLRTFLLLPIFTSF